MQDFGLLLALTVSLGGCLSFHPQPLPNEPKSATFVQIGDTRVHYVDRPGATAGSDSKGTVVLIHGFGASLTEWLPLMPVLTRHGYRVVALDLRGHGWTARPRGDYSIAGQARLVLSLLDHLRVERFTVVGHSWGSAVALQLVVQVPARVTRVVLYNGMFFEDQQPTLFSWARLPLLGELIYGVFYRERQDEKMAFAFYEPDKHVTEDVVERLEEYMDRPGFLAASLAGIRAMKYEMLQTHYRTIRQPVLIIWGREDQVTPLEYGERLANELPRARLFVVPRCGHLPMIEVPAATSHELLRFLRGGV